MRESLFEKLKSKKINYAAEIMKIYSLLKNYHVGEFYRISLKISDYSAYFDTFDNAVLEILSDEPYEDLLDLLTDAQLGETTISLDAFLDFLEFLRVLHFAGANSGFARDYIDLNVAQTQTIIEEDCRKLGYCFKFDKREKTYKLMLSNPAAEAVAINSRKTTAELIYRYLMIRTGNVQQKRECIKSLADEVENLCKKYSSVSEYDKLKQFIQCVRHTKDSPVVNFPFYYKDEEKWLDKTFEMIIGVLAFTKTKEIVKEIKTLENQ